MDSYFPTWLHRCFHRHPRLMIAALMLLAMVAWAVIFAQSGKPLVVYEGF